MILLLAYVCVIGLVLIANRGAHCNKLPRRDD
jgi:hypothetical protein